MLRNNNECVLEMYVGWGAIIDVDIARISQSRFAESPGYDEVIAILAAAQQYVKRRKTGKTFEYIIYVCWSFLFRDASTFCVGFLQQDLLLFNPSTVRCIDIFFETHFTKRWLRNQFQNWLNA